MKKLVCLLLMVFMMLTLLSACKTKHTHTFDEAWQSDETDHWHQANCEHAEEIADKAPHEDLDDNDLCDVCGYAMNHTHTHSDKWSFNKDEHYHAPTCGCNANDKKYQKDNAPHVDKDNDAVCDVCGYDYDHTHVYDTDIWTKADEKYHWHAPTCGHDVDGADKEEHMDEDNDGICDGCDWDYDHTHTYEGTWSTDGDYHWYKATCGHSVFGEKNPHRDQDEDGKCDQCEITPEHFHDMDWDVWSGDETNHWHAAKGDCASCVDSEGNPIVAGFGKHEEWKEDGICDVCEYIVFHLYKIDVVLPDISGIVDAEGKPVLGEDGNPVVMPFIVREGKTLEFYVSVPSTHRLEGVTGAEVDMLNYIKLDNEDGTTTYLYKITLTPEADTTINVNISKLSSVEEVANGEVVFDVTGNGKMYKDISFTPDETGRYVIVCLEKDDINFGPAGNVPTMQNSYEFDGVAGQTVNLQAMYWPFNVKGQQTFKYHILRVDEVFVLPYLEGEGFLLPAKVNTTFKFTLPEPGLYQFTTTLGQLVWVSDEDAAGTVLPQFFLCTYAGQEFTHTGKYTDVQSSVTYDFDWKIVKMNEAGALSTGANGISVDVTKYTGHTFTAPATGYYSFQTSDNVQLYMMGAVNANGIATMATYGGSENFLLAGQTIRLYVSVNSGNNSAPSTNFSDTLTITFDGYTPEANDYGVTLHPGTSYSYTAEKSGLYTFEVDGDGNFVRVNGGAWAKKHDVSLEAGTTVKLEIRSDKNTSVRIGISYGVFEHTVSVGSTIYKFYPKRTYTVYLSGGQSPKPQQTYILNWSDVNLSVSYNGSAITSGKEFTYTPGTALSVIYNATGSNSIRMELVDLYEPVPEEQVLNNGHNAVALTGGPFGREMIFTARAAGTYVLKLAEGETNAKIVIGNTTYTAENLPVELELTQGEELSMMVYTVNGVSDSVNFSILNGTIDPDQPGQPGTPDVPDVPDVPEIPNDEILYGTFYTDYDVYDVNFTGNVLTLVDKTAGNRTYTFTFVRVEDTVTLYDANGNVPTNFSIKHMAGGWALIVAGQADPVILHEEEEDAKQTSTELTIGENAFYLTNGTAGVTLGFEVPQDGTYILSTAPGERNAFVMYEPYPGYAELAIDGSGSHTVYLREGDILQYGVASADYSSDTINLYFVRQEGYPHYHTFSEAWVSDADGHWHRANCAHTDRTTKKEAHKDENRDGDCDDCGRTYRTVYKVDFKLPEGSIAQDMAGEPITGLLLNPISGEYTLDCYLLIPDMYDVETIQILINGQNLHQKLDDADKAVDYWEVDDSEPGYWTVYIHKTKVDKNLTVTAKAESPSRPAQVIEANKEVTIDFTGKEVGENVYFTITFQADTRDYYYISGKNGMLISLVEEGQGMPDMLLHGNAEAVLSVYGVATYDGGDRIQTFGYSIHKSGSYDLPSLNGAGLQLTTGVPSRVSVTLPESGLYLFTAGDFCWTVDNTIYNKQDFYYEGKKGEQVTLFVDKVFGEDEKKTEEYVLSWNVERVEESGALEVGTNAVQAPVDGYSAYTFTAQIAGTYLFKLDNGTMTNLHTYEYGHLAGEVDSYFLYNLKFGETVTLYVYGLQERDEEGNVVENQKPIADSVTVVALGYGSVLHGESWTHNYQIDNINSVTAQTNSMYKVTVLNGQISLDGTNWIDGIDQLVLAEHESLFFLVKHNSSGYHAVEVKFERISLSADFVQGENTLTMVPGAEYEINVNDLSKYALLWNSDLDITVTAGGKALANGENTTEPKLYVIYNGQETAEITFQVSDRASVVLPDPLVEGENTLTLRPGVEYEVTVDGMANYALIWDAAYNVTVTAADGNVANGAVTTATVLRIVYNGDAEAQITFQVADRSPVVVEAEWVEGTNTLTLAPGKNYVVTLPAWEYAPGLFGYTFSWDNEAVILYHGSLPTNDTAIGPNTAFAANVVSGVLHTGDAQTLILLNTSDAEVTVDVTLEKPMMIIGDNSVTDETYLWGDEALVFTAAETGFYTFTATDVIWIGDEEVAAGDTYSVIINAGQTVSITLDSGEDEVIITIAKS